MDINTLRIIATIASFVMFLGIIVWAWKRRNTSDFKDAANLPFTDIDDNIFYIQNNTFKIKVL